MLPPLLPDHSFSLTQSSSDPFLTTDASDTEFNLVIVNLTESFLAHRVKDLNQLILATFSVLK